MTVLLPGGHCPLEKPTFPTQQKPRRLAMSGKSGIFEAPCRDFSVGGPQNVPDLRVLKHVLPQPVIMQGVFPCEAAGKRQVTVSI